MQIKWLSKIFVIITRNFDSYTFQKIFYITINFRIIILFIWSNNETPLTKMFAYNQK